MSEWQDISTAPMDGSSFLVRYLPYLGGYLCMRRVRWVADEDQAVMQDLGGWIIVGGIDDDFIERLPTSGEPSWSIASDDHNDTSKWVWQPLPDPPGALAETFNTAWKAKFDLKETT